MVVGLGAAVSEREGEGAAHGCSTAYSRTLKGGEEAREAGEAAARSASGEQAAAAVGGRRRA
jgi:hypothetical protein